MRAALWTAGTVLQASFAFVSVALDPFADGAATDAEGSGDVLLADALMVARYHQGSTIRRGSGMSVWVHGDLRLDGYVNTNTLKPQITVNNLLRGYN